MWKYKNVTRAEFEKRKDFVESILAESGASPTKLSRAHHVSHTDGSISESIVSARTIFEYKKEYFRVSEVLFDEKPFIVIEWTDREDHAASNAMEDTDPFPYDLTDDDVIKEVESVLGVKFG